LNKRCRPHLKPTNKSYRTDETYIKVKGKDKFLYRAVDSTGQTIDFLLTAKRDATAAKRFFRKALSAPGNPVPRVINVDKSPAFPPAVEKLKTEGVLPRRVRPRQGQYLNARQIRQLCDSLRTVYLAFDADSNGSGQQAAESLSCRLREGGVIARLVSLPEGHDPNSFFVSGGNAQEFHNLLERACL
jgi:transposase-like protein